MREMGCKPNHRLTQRTRQPGETEEGVVQETTHSDRSGQVLVSDEDANQETHNTENISDHQTQKDEEENRNQQERNTHNTDREKVMR